VTVISLLARAAAADPCVPPDADPVMMAIGGGKLSYCFEDDADQLRCFATDAATGKTAAVPAPAPLGRSWPRQVPAPRAVKIKRAEGKAPVLCRADGSRCKTLKMTHEIDAGMGLVNAHNAALTLAALSTLEWIDTFDLRTGKRIASFGTGPAQSSCNWLGFAGDTLVIGEKTCGGDSMTAWLATVKGAKLADVGGDAPIELGPMAMAPAGGDLHAFATWSGDAVVVHDVKTGVRVRRIALGAAVAGSAAYLLGDGTTLAVVYGGARAGDVAIVDTANGKATAYPARRCAP
jgi:hypothetical protein